MYTAAQLAELSGEKAYKNTPMGGQYFDTIKQGQDGKFYKEFYSQKKDERPDAETLGDTVKLTILKIRRKLSKWENKEQVLESVEYDAGATSIPTTQGELSEKDAKARGAKVALVLYVLHNGGVAKMSVSGGSLYNPDDTEDLRLYSYLQSFEGDEEHTFMYETIIGSKVNMYTDSEGFEKTNNKMTFKRGALHADLQAVGDALTALPEILIENDARDLKWLGSSKPKVEASGMVAEVEKKAAYPTPESEGIDPDDIPF